MIRVVLVDDQTLVRAGLVKLLDLTPDIRVIAEAADGVAALQAVEESTPDVVLLDVRMPRMDGVAVLAELNRLRLRVPAVLLTTFDDDEPLREGVKAGARGFLLKDVSLDRLAEAIRTVAAGGTLIQPAITERLLLAARRLPCDFESLEPPDPLTPRETEILRLMAGGFSNREIACTFGTSEGTVKNHASNILSKLGVRDRTRAVLKGLDRGYI
jgi:DNA-binding NarL/FixJ family response regulator